MCMESKHFSSGSPVRLETCLKGRGEAGWSHGQVRSLVDTTEYRHLSAVKSASFPVVLHTELNFVLCTDSTLPS